MSGNNNKFLARALICCMIFMLPFLFQGCASSHLSEDFGKSYENVFYAQTVNHEAPDDKTAVDGCPGVVAEGIYSEYLDAFGGKSFAEQIGEMILNRN